MPVKFSESVRAGRRTCAALLLIALYALRTPFLAPRRGRRRLAAAAALMTAMIPQTALAASPLCDSINSGGINGNYAEWQMYTVGDPDTEPFAAGETLTYSYANFASIPILRLHSASGHESLVEDYTGADGVGSYTIPEGSDFSRFLIGNNGEGSVIWTISCAAAPIAAPAITGITPNEGPMSGGDLVNIVGSGFSGATEVLFGSLAAGNLNVLNDGQISVTAPETTISGPTSISVTGPGGTGTADDAYYYLPASPELSVSVGHSGTPIQGQSFTLTVQVSNSGGATPVPVTVQADHSAGLSYSSANGAVWSCGASLGQVSCTSHDVIAAGATESLSLNFVIAGDAAVSQVVSVNASDGTNRADGTDSFSVQQTPVGFVDASGSGQSAAVGSNFASTLKVKLVDAGGVGVPGTTVAFQMPVPTGSEPTATLDDGNYGKLVTTDAWGVADSGAVTASGSAGNYLGAAILGSIVEWFSLTNSGTASTDATLSALTVSSGTLSPGFDSGTTTYSVVGNTTPGLTVTPTANHAGATITVNGASVASGASAEVPLNMGANQILVFVTAEDGSSTEAYSLTVTREAETANAKLGGLIGSGAMSPAFDPDTTSYTMPVAEFVTTAQLAPTAQDGGATITVGGNPTPSGFWSTNIPLSVGDNVVPIVVTASDGSATQTYTVTITRAESADASLSNLTVSAGTLVFNQEPFFRVDVANSVDAITVTPTATKAGATVAVQGNPVISGSPSESIPLAVGANLITVLVTAPNGEATLNYLILVERAASSDATLSSLTTSAGTLSPAFAPGTNAYSLSVDSSTASIGVTPTAAHAGARIAVGSSPATSGSEFGPIPLDPGENVVTINVEAEDGSSTTSYVLTITRSPPAPTVADRSFSVAYNSSGAAFDLSGAISGQHGAIAIAAPPANGTTSIAGDVVTYTPSSGYYGPDSFTYTATGDGGTSAPAAVTITVAPPAAPVVAEVSGVTVAFGSAGVPIDVSSAVSGVHSSIAVNSGPAHGTVSVAGDVITYTPTAGYFGPDSFTYSATGPGGTSPQATVSLMVASPVAPTVAGRAVSVAYQSSGIAIDLGPQVSGLYSSVAVVTPPEHGTVAVAGDVVTYTPAPGYYGDDSFAFTATGPGGTSAPATVALTIANPAAPVVGDRSGVTVPYQSSGIAIDLSGVISGVHSAISVATPPAHGTVSVSGDVVTYIPASGYHGGDSFTFTATGPGGTSAEATVSLTVASPGAPGVADLSGVAVPYQSSGTAIDLSGSITGVHSSIAIVTAPAHGTLSMAGDVVTYKPAPGYAGADGFTYAATGPGGTSEPGTVSLTVGAPTLAIGPETLPVAQDQAAYAATLTAAGGTAPYRFDVSGGALPKGVTLSGEGALGGTPSGHGSFTFTVTATDSSTGTGPFSVARDYVLTVTPPAPPTAGEASATVAFGSADNEVELALSGTKATSVAVATAPGHGTATADGLEIRYTPAAGYYGADSFTYTASNAGGSSAPAKVTITVGLPPAPVAARKAEVEVAYGAETAIDLSESVTGVHTALAVAAAPTHGTVTVAGDIVTYKPTPGYAGADSFTYTATGPGGTSDAAAVLLTVRAPEVAITTEALAEGQADAAYTASVEASGGAAPYAFAVTEGALPAGLALSGAGVLSGTPTAFGSFTFTLSVTDSSTGAGPFTAKREYALVIAPPPAPEVTDAPETTVNSSTLNSDQTVDIDLSALVTGRVTEIRIETPPEHGEVTVGSSGGASILSLEAAAPAPARTIATYRPHRGYSGPDAFTFVAIGPGGTSRPARVSLTVVGLKPTAPTLTATTMSGQQVEVDLTATASEGPFTGAAILSVTPGDSAAAELVEQGAAGARSYRMRITPGGRFSGAVVISYTLSNAFGASDPATVTVNVEARPDPSKDPTVAGITAAEADSARRLAGTQIANFSRRNEQLHNGGHGSTGDPIGVSFSGEQQLRQRPGEGIDLPDAVMLKMEHGMSVWGAELASGSVSRHSGWGDLQSAMRVAGARSQAAARGAGEAPSLTRDKPAGRSVGSAAIWSGGAVQVGTRDAESDRSKLALTSSGLSAGIDVKLDEDVIVGLGGGYGAQRTRVGGGQGQVDATSWSGAAYGSFRPMQNAFVDVVAGFGELRFDNWRIAPNGALARGDRQGDLRFGALSAGYDGRGKRWNLSGYGTLEYIAATLDTYAETGAGLFNLRFGEREVESVTGLLGLRASLTVPSEIGVFKPNARFEWRHEFATAGSQALDYADLTGLTYSIDGNDWMRDQLGLELGFDLEVGGGWSFGSSIQGRAGDGGRTATVRFGVTRRF